MLQMDHLVRWFIYKDGGSIYGKIPLGSIYVQLPEGNLQKYVQRYKNDPLQYTGAADTGCWQLRDPKQLWSKADHLLPELLLNSSTDICLIFPVRNTNERKTNMHYPLGRECDKMWLAIRKTQFQWANHLHSLILWSEFWVFQAHFLRRPCAVGTCRASPISARFSKRISRTGKRIRWRKLGLAKVRPLYSRNEWVKIIGESFILRLSS
jgi:hypothetical protein